jgi:hypothetical protein
MQDTIMKHEGILGEFRGVLGGLAIDITYIKRRVDDGLAVKIDRIDKDLTASIASGKIEAAEIKADVEVKAAEIKGEDWLKRIVTGSMAKLIGAGFIFIVLSAAASSGMGLYLKEKYSLEAPGQQKAILQKQETVLSVLDGYHSHPLLGGRSLFHAGDPNKPAWILDPKTNLWERAPGMRTEEGLNGKQ